MGCAERWHSQGSGPRSCSRMESTSWMEPVSTSRCPVSSCGARRGSGPASSSGAAVWTSAWRRSQSAHSTNVTVADLTISHVGFHGIHVRGGEATSGVVIHHVHILDTGQQLIKVSTSAGTGLPATAWWRVPFSSIRTMPPAITPTAWTCTTVRRWVVRDSVLRRIRGPAPRLASRPAILFWNGVARHGRRAQLRWSTATAGSRWGSQQTRGERPRTIRPPGGASSAVMQSAT